MAASMTPSHVIDLTREEVAGQGSDEERFGLLYEAYSPRVRGLLRKLVRDRHAVEDLLQETFLRAYNVGLHWEEPGEHEEPTPWPWLAAVARNLVLDQARRTHGVVHSELEEEGDPHMGGLIGEPEALLAASRRRQGIIDALELVSERHRRVLVMKHVEGKQYDEIASIEGLSMEAVKSVLRRARRTFRESYAVVSERQGLGALVAGGFITRLQGRLRDLRDRLIGMGEAMTGSFAAMSQTAANTLMTAVVVGAVVVASGSGAGAGSEVEREDSPVLIEPASSVTPAPAPYAAGFSVHLEPEVTLEPEPEAHVDAGPSAHAPTPAPPEPAPSASPVHHSAAVTTTDAPVVDSAVKAGARNDTSVGEEETSLVTAASFSQDDLDYETGESGLGATITPCPDDEYRGAVTGTTCSLLGR